MSIYHTPESIPELVIDKNVTPKRNICRKKRTNFLDLYQKNIVNDNYYRNNLVFRVREESLLLDKYKNYEVNHLYFSLR